MTDSYLWCHMWRYVDIDPSVGEGSQLIGDRVGSGGVGVAINFELPAIVGAEIGGDVADAEAAVGGEIIFMRGGGFKRPGVLGVPVAEFARNRPGVVGGVEVHGVDEMAPRLRAVGREDDRAAERGDRFIELAGFGEGGNELGEKLGFVGGQSDGTAHRGEGVVDLAACFEGLAEIAVGVRVIGFQGDRSADQIYG